MRQIVPPPDMTSLTLQLRDRRVFTLALAIRGLSTSHVVTVVCELSSVPLFSLPATLDEEYLRPSSSSSLYSAYDVDSN